MVFGAIVGDIVGSQYEGHKPESYDFPLFTRHCRVTDDTILTLATAHALRNQFLFADHYREFYRRYPHAGFGGRFIEWANVDNAPPYYSYGNGAVMRISPVGYLFSLKDVLRVAQLSASCTHNHPTAIKAAQAVASVIWAAQSKKNVIQQINNTGYPIIDIPEHAYGFYSAQSTTSIAFAIIAKATSYEQAIRTAVFLGGDTDTLAAVVGSIAEPMFGIPPTLKTQALTYMDDFQKEMALHYEQN